jgi:hypothetical protein
LALGVYPIVSLGEARRKRDEAQKLVSDGIDPSEKKADKIEQSEALTFESVARDWHTACKNGLIPTVREFYKAWKMVSLLLLVKEKYPSLIPEIFLPYQGC